ncbi:MAG TPA: hypothetical protein VEJ63_08085 [Planctomycetota bacterium]|nr:hypothetical protein [Planctomycetota bacterium]
MRLSTLVFAMLVAALGLHVITKPYEYESATDPYAGRDFYSILPCEARGWPRVWHKRLTVTPEFFPPALETPIPEEAREAILKLGPWLNKTNFAFDLAIVAFASVAAAAIFEITMRRLQEPR